MVKFGSNFSIKRTTERRKRIQAFILTFRNLKKFLIRKCLLNIKEMIRLEECDFAP